MWRYLVLLMLVLSVAFVGYTLIDGSGGDVAADAQVQSGAVDLSRFARATEPRDWVFPRDHGAHPNFQTEWWYYTGNLSDEDGRRFGFQFTLFRRAIDPTLVADDSEWRTGQVYFAHFTVSDLEGERFLHDERYSRGGAGLAGAQPVYGDESTYDLPYRAWLEDWQVIATNDDATTFDLQAASVSDDGTPFAVDLALDMAKPIALQGEGTDGFSRKGREVGNASYYYTIPRQITEGTLTIGDETFTVSGQTWMDHEFGTSVLDATTTGWDWFGLIFDDGSELMVGQVRLDDDAIATEFGGLRIYPDGSTKYLPSDVFTLEATGAWESPHTGATYPIGWNLTVAGGALDGDGDLTITITPLAEDQELHSGDIAYWEGAVEISGDATGYGYAELTGYVDTMTGRF